ncbi:DUF4830 domain-containing protein [Paenibacillus soyae]|uniref:DUF4830 domain-containing protein n=1 Tax=Paenibacillus soyae TaxID=2969249 RepID=A0A9X2MSW0_9BACL|nr:DUF4830 domain-containing protein [Paenibacillus soyae]MCR2805830.1 DUF4830 domain-containing protein [Paenibacillus soyae]
MRRAIHISIIIGLVLIIICGCAKEDANDEKIAEQYVENQGYIMTSRKGEIHQYVLDKGMLLTTHDRQIWAVQKEEPEKYLGKEITLYGFTVNNHPLGKIYNRETNVSVMVCEGKVIGGTSFPVQEELLLLGAPYSLDGRTLEEVKGVSYQEWTEGWDKKYGN